MYRNDGYSNYPPLPMPPLPQNMAVEEDLSSIMSIITNSNRSIDNKASSRHDRNNGSESQPLIGPVMPEGMVNNMGTDAVDMDVQNDEDLGHGHNHRDGRGKGRDRDRADRRDSRDRSRRNRASDRDRSDRGDRVERNEKSNWERANRYRNDRDGHSHRERKSKWSDRDDLETNEMAQQAITDGSMMPGSNRTMGSVGLLGHAPGQPLPGVMPGMMPGVSGNMVMQNGMMAYNNMMNNNAMGQSAMGMGNMGNMMPGMNMVGNVSEPNMMMNSSSMMPQPICYSEFALLPAIPGTSLPVRREKPPGCRTIFIGGLPYNVTEEIVNEIFQRFGLINDIKLHHQGVCHVRFANADSMEASFALSGYRFKYHNQSENEATVIFIDYSLNRDDQNEYERSKRMREPTPPRVEPFSPNNLTSIIEKIKSETDFAQVAPTVQAWLERGECNKRNANSFYSLIQSTNNQTRRLYNEKMMIDEEFQNMKSTFRDKFAQVLLQFEQVAKILAAAKHQRVSDHFTKQQRRNIDMWLKMSEEVPNIREEFNVLFDEEEVEKTGRNVVSIEKYEELRAENKSLLFELEGYKNEAHLAKTEAERKFEKFKAHFVAQQALMGHTKPQYPTMMQPPIPEEPMRPPSPKPKPPPPLPPSPEKKIPETKHAVVTSPPVPATEARLISVLATFLMVHPLGASLDYLVSYVKSMVPDATQSFVNEILEKFPDVFERRTSGVGASIEHKWFFITFNMIKRG